MILHVLRALFVLLMAAVGFFYLYQNPPSRGSSYLEYWIPPAIGLVLGGILVCIDILAPARRKLAIFSGTFLGLIVGLAFAYVLSFVVQVLVQQYVEGDKGQTAQFINMLISIITCYLAISFILQTKDDFRFIIPYVEFTKQTKGARPMLVDTSILIDGRIGDIASTGVI